MKATFTPSLETIKDMATPEELAFIEIIENLGPEYEVFYQPPIELAHVDFAILKRGSGLFLVEVSNLNLDCVQVHVENNHEFYTLPSIIGKLISPFEAVNSYKDEFYNLLSEELFKVSINRENTGAYGLIQTAVFLPNATLVKLVDIYKDNPRLDRRKYGRDPENRYTWAFVECTNDWIAKQIVSGLRTRELFSDELYDSIKEVLSGNWQQNIIRKENLHIKKYQYNADRKLHAKSSMRDRIRGVAGSGKTMYAVQRAIIRYQNTKEPVLVLCYNLTLVNYLKDMIVRHSPELSDYDRLYNIRVADYDSFMPQMMETNGFDPLYFSAVDREEDDEREYDQEENEARWRRLHAAQIKVFDDNEKTVNYTRYQTIIIDEYQDFDPEWLRAIEHHFCAKGGELFVLADEKQKIYDNARILNKELDTPGIMNDWLILSEPHRMTNELIDVAVAFQRSCLRDLFKVDEVEVIEHDFIHEKSILEYCNISGLSTADIVDTIKQFVKRVDVDYKDTTVLSGSSDILRDIEAYIAENDKDISTITTFESLAMKQAIEQSYGRGSVACMMKKKAAARIRKYHFRVFTNEMKLSSVNSFKGLETEAVVYILNKNEKNASKVYTAITRAKKHLLVLNMGNQKFDSFFRNPENGFVRVSPVLQHDKKANVLSSNNLLEDELPF